MKRIIRTSALKNGFLSKDRFLISLLFTLCMGILIGSVALCTGYTDKDAILNRICDSYIHSRQEQSIFLSFFASFSSNFIMLLSAYVLGVCGVGIPFLYIIPFIDGIGKGTIIGYIYAKFGYAGLLKSILVVIPQNVAFCFLILIAVSLSLRMSYQTFCNLSSIQSNSSYISFKKYNQKYVFLIIASICFSFVDALIWRFTQFIPM